MKSVTVGQTISATGAYGVRFERIISNDYGTIVVFSKNWGEDKTYRDIPVGSTFSISTVAFKVVSVEIPKNITVVQRIG